MPIIEIIRNIVVAVAATISLFHYGPHSEPILNPYD